MARPSLGARVAALEARLDRLERGGSGGAAAQPTATAGDSGAVDDERASMQFLDALSRRGGGRWTRGDTAGALGYAGWVQVGERRYAWTRETPVPEVADLDPGEVARWIAAIASPQRVMLLLELFGSDRTSPELAAALDGASTGQVYHHLKELQAAGIVLQVRRGVYRIAPHHFIPLLVLLAVAGQGVEGSAGTAMEPFPGTATDAEASR